MSMPDEALPEGWGTAKLPDVVYFAGRIGWRGLKAEEYAESGPILLSVPNLNHGDIVDFSSVVHISHDRYEESPEIAVREGDTLLTKDGAGIGKIGFVAHLPGEATVNSSLLLLRSLGALLPKFLFYSLKGPRMQSLVKERITGSTTPHLFQKDIKNFDLAIPPLAEQERIVALVESLLLRIAKVREQLESAAAILGLELNARGNSHLVQTVLAKAFRGELVETEADLARREGRDYEPATVLLERIALEQLHAQSHSKKSSSKRAIKRRTPKEGC